jgi:excisionase family DNA binding protein
MFNRFRHNLAKEKNMKERLTLKEAARYLGHSSSWLYANHRVLGLPGYRIGSRWFFDLDDLNDWAQSLKVKGGCGLYRPLHAQKKVIL